MRSKTKLVFRREIDAVESFVRAVPDLRLSTASAEHGAQGKVQPEALSRIPVVEMAGPAAENIGLGAFEVIGGIAVKLNGPRPTW